MLELIDGGRGDAAAAAVSLLVDLVSRIDVLREKSFTRLVERTTRIDYNSGAAFMKRRSKFGYRHRHRQAEFQSRKTHRTHHPITSSTLEL